jgi:hypothetical protein
VSKGRGGDQDPDPQVRAYFLSKVMRQGKPDDVFSFVTLRELHNSQQTTSAAS